METRSSAAHVVPRERGGWLAVSGPDTSVRIAVVAETEAAAREAFAAEAAAWDRLAEKAANRTAIPVARGVG